MRCMIAVSNRPIQFVDAMPIHELDFCDTCGDCLHCHGDDACAANGGVHVWVVEQPARAETILASLLNGGAR